jgi:hypothetical protein
MARVTDEEVKEIISTSLDTTAFITAANLIVSEFLDSSGLTDAHLKEIERWLAAHLVAIRDPKVLSEAIGDAQATYEVGILGRGLNFTSYGQQVLILDTTGKLASVGKREAKIETIQFDLGT